MTAALQPIHTVGNLLGVKTSALLAKLTPFAAECAAHLALTVPHGLNALSATTRLSRARASELCGRWLEALPGDELEVEVGADGSTIARSDEAALPDGAPALVSELGDLAVLGYNGASWQYVVEHDNEDAEATAALLDRIAGEVGVSEAQRRVAGGLHRSLARGKPSRAWLRGKATLEPVLALAWDAVEWQPIQHMLGGFYPQLGVVSQIPRLQRAAEVDAVTLELLLGPTDPPALRFTMRVA